MAGNTARQDAFQIPILFHLAAYGDVPTKRDGRRKSDEKEGLQYSVLERFGFTEEQRFAYHRRSRKPVLDNDLDWAIKEMVEAGEVERSQREYISITDKGLKRLRNYVYRVISRISRPELEALIQSRSPAHRDTLLVHLLGKLDPNELYEAVQFVSETKDGDCNNLFLSSLREISDDGLKSFLRDAEYQIPRLLVDDVMKGQERRIRQI